MIDAKCEGTSCPDRRHCWRYVAPATVEQSWADYWRHRNAHQCRHFEPLTAERWDMLLDHAVTAEDPW